MSEELMNFDLPVDRSSIIKVVGIGGGGSNAVNHMFKKGIKDVDFMVCNTDAQDLDKSPVSVKLQIGESITEGRGAGSKPDVGRQAAQENLDDVIEIISGNTKMVFLTAGMGGGTGTGATPVIAKACREMGILTVAIVTIPFRFEGNKRARQATDGIDELKDHVDSLLVIDNEKLREMYGDQKISEAFGKADDILTKAARGIAEIITVHGYINVDFADVETVMHDSGVAMVGSGEAEGEDRARKAVEMAITSPLLNSDDITGARSILLNITSGEEEISMDEIGEITDYINEAAAEDVMIIWGTGVDESLGNMVSVTVIATGFEANSIPQLFARKKGKRREYHLEDEASVASAEKIEPDTGFVVKETDMAGFVVDETNLEQRTIDFELSTDIEEEGIDEDISFEDEDKTRERLQKMKKHQDYLKHQGYLEEDKDNEIDRLESQPAYMRKNIKISKPDSDTGSKISKYSLSDDEENGTRLNPNNSFLHDNVD